MVVMSCVIKILKNYNNYLWKHLIIIDVKNIYNMWLLFIVPIKDTMHNCNREFELENKKITKNK